MILRDWSPCQEIEVLNVVESAIIVTNVQTFQDCALHQWNVVNALYVLPHDTSRLSPATFHKIS